ncbi:MAG: Trk system potassium transporter TrkA [Acidimicrobiales bacterium]|nr:Trk system potassium transporter TrkA [Acidimicrobiales bacterium]
MYVIVVGAGEVGTYVADRLSREGHDVAVVERDRTALRAVSEQLDVLTLLGSGTNPEVLKEAGIGRAEMIVAVTSQDEVNLVCCLVGKQAGIARTVCRLEDADLRSRKSTALHDAMGVDLIIDPDFETAQEILELLEYPGASEVAEMAGGEVVVIGARLPKDAPIVGRSLVDIAAEYEPEWEFLFGVITRGEETIIPRGDVTLEADDLVRVLCKRRARRQLMDLLGLARRAPRRIMLLGGGRTAELVGKTLDDRGSDVVIVERDHDRASELAGALGGALVINGEITDADLLEENEVGDFDAVLALTGEDDANILACLYAKLEGARETIAVVHRLSLLTLLTEAGIDVALSPRTASANGVLRFVRGDVSAVATFLQGEAEVIELEVKEGSPADGGIVAELRLPKEVLVGAFVRDGKAQIARGRSELRDRDHVVLFSMPGFVEDVRRVFG